MESLEERTKNAANDLEKLGYAVIKGVYSREEAEQIHHDMWSCLEKASDGKLKQGVDYTKVKAKYLPPHQHGILHTYRVNHAPPVRQVRRDPRIIKIFASFYGTDQLTCSMDRVNFKFPGKVYESKKPWPHADQDPRLLGRVTIQSYLSLTDAGEDAPSNRLYEGSHLIFDEFFKERRLEKGPIDNWTTLDEHEAYSLGKTCPLVKPILEKGDMLFWDSRTVHSPSDGSNYEGGRFVIYLCYNKLWEKEGDQTFLNKKKQAFLACHASRHTPIPQSLFPKGPRIYDPSKPPLYASFTKEQLGIEDVPQGAEKYLFGFSPYGGKEGLNLGEGWNHGEKPLLHFVSPFTPLLHKVAKKRGAEDLLPKDTKKVKVVSTKS
jgi:hypothetical protein